MIHAFHNILQQLARFRRRLTDATDDTHVFRMRAHVIKVPRQLALVQERLITGTLDVIEEDLARALAVESVGAYLALAEAQVRTQCLSRVDVETVVAYRRPLAVHAHLDATVAE